MEDVAPELLDSIERDIIELLKENEELGKLYDCLAKGNATYEEAHNFAIELGNILTSAYKNNISSDVLPDGRMYYNIAKRVIEPTMQGGYGLVADYSAEVQKQLNEVAGIGIKAITPELNTDRIDGIINRISSEENMDDVAWILDEPVKLFLQSVVDDSVKVNAEFQSESGMSPKIIRKLAGGCCDWCREVAGTYEYPDNVPKDVYRRHQRCRCQVLFKPDKSRRVQNVHTKEWEKIEISEETTQKYKPIIRGEKENIIIGGDKKLLIQELEGYEGIYIESETSIKPKALHNISMNIEEGIRLFGEGYRQKPKVIIVDRSYLLGCLGKYSAVENVLLIIPEVGDRASLTEYMVLDSNISFKSTEYHELWHWKQAQSYGKNITHENYIEYMLELNKNCRINIDKLGITEYNVSNISKYAKDQFDKGRFDEVEAEYYTKYYLGR